MFLLNSSWSLLICRAFHDVLGNSTPTRQKTSKFRRKSRLDPIRLSNGRTSRVAAHRHAFCILHVLPGAGQSPHCSLLDLAWLSTPPIPINILCKGEVSSLIIIGDNISYKSFLRCHTHMQCIWFDLSHRCGRTSQRRTSKAPTQSTSFCIVLLDNTNPILLLWHAVTFLAFQPFPALHFSLS